MQAVALCSLKGGTGKTTLAYNLAERAQAAGRRVSLVDFDPQEGCIGLADLRDNPPDWSVSRGQVNNAAADEVDRMRRADEVDLLVCDLPGVDSMALGLILGEMDLILSPVGIGASDLLAAANFAAMIRRMNLPVIFVPNNVSLAGSGRIDLLREELIGMRMTVAPLILGRRVAHVDALRRGLGVCEYAQRSVAAEEVKAFWEWTAARLSGNVEYGVPANGIAGGMEVVYG